MSKQTDLLRGVCLLGLVVFLCLAGALALLSLLGGIPLFSSGSGTFAQALKAYDETIRENPGLAPRRRNALLNSLEKKALDTENVLSVLKRRRFPALHEVPGREAYVEAYIEAAERVRQLYPYSAQVGALAAEALILSTAGRPLSGEAAVKLQDLAALMSRGALQDLSLACSVYSGAMGDPASARFLPGELFPLLCSLTRGEERERYLVNACIRILLDEPAGSRQTAVAMVNSLFSETDRGSAGNSAPLLPETFRFGGEFFYDHGNFLRAAELFSVFTDDRGLARQGDALWLGNFVEQARVLWRTAASGAVSAAGAAAVETAGSLTNGTEDGTDPASVRVRVLYNLAATAPDPREEGQWLEQLLGGTDSAKLPGRVFGIIRYSRIAPLDRALLVLEETDLNEGLFDLELLRRKSEGWTVDRTVAETWMLLNRHPGDPRLFEWAAWYFDFQHRYDETLLVLRNAGINRVEGPWSGLHRAFAQVRENALDEAEKTLQSIVRSPGEAGKGPGRRQQPLWQAAADLGLLLEKRGNLQTALEYYEIAAGQLAAVQLAASQLTAGQLTADQLAADQLAAEGKLPVEDSGIPAAGVVPERRDAARIQLCIAGVLRSLGQEPESRRALEYALDLDPENLEARLELRRLDAGRGIL
jgi:tetratricopeptide (TPR) repeat protein